MANPKLMTYVFPMIDNETGEILLVYKNWAKGDPNDSWLEAAIYEIFYQHPKELRGTSARFYHELDITPGYLNVRCHEPTDAEEIQVEVALHFYANYLQEKLGRLTKPCWKQIGVAK